MCVSKEIGCCNIFDHTHEEKKDFLICCHSCQNKMNPITCLIMSIEKVKQLCRVQPVFFNNYCTLCAVLTNVCSKRVFINILKWGMYSVLRCKCHLKHQECPFLNIEIWMYQKDVTLWIVQSCWDWKIE